MIGSVSGIPYVAQVEENTNFVTPNFRIVPKKCHYSRNIVIVILERVGDGFANVGICGEVHHNLNLLLLEDLLKQRSVAEIPLVEGETARNRRAMAEYEIVQDHWFVARVFKLAETMAADIAAAAYH